MSFTSGFTSTVCRYTSSQYKHTHTHTRLQLSGNQNLMDYYNLLEIKFYLVRCYAFLFVYENFTSQGFWRVPQLLLLMNAYAQCQKLYWPQWKTLEALLKLRLCQSHLLCHIDFIPPFFHPHLHSLPLPISTLSLESKALHHCWVVCIIWHVPSTSITKRKVEWLLLVPFEPFGRSRCR